MTCDVFSGTLNRTQSVSRQLWGQKGTGPEHVRQPIYSKWLSDCYSVDADWGARDGVHIGTTWRIWLNRLCPVAIRTYVKLFWPLVVHLAFVSGVTPGLEQNHQFHLNGCFLSSVLVKRLDVKNISKMTYFVLTETSNLNSKSESKVVF